MNSKYQFKITVESIPGQLPGKTENTYFSPLEFHVGNHDNILEIVQKIRASSIFDENSATSFAVGLKLFTEIMLQNKDNPLFEELRPAMLAFMKKLKTQLKANQA